MNGAWYFLEGESVLRKAISTLAFAVAPLSAIDRVRRVVLSGCLLLPCMGLAQGHAWLPVEAQDLKMKEFSAAPGAEAVQLYYADEIDDVDHTEFFYSRIKVLTDGGKRHANIEIPMLEKTSINELYARTILPDGTIVEFTDKPFEKTVYRGKGIKFRVQAFTLPQVTAGSIIEYRYQLHYGDKGLHRHRWIVQHDIFAVKQHFRLRYDKHNSVRWLSTPGLEKTPENNLQAGTVQMDLDNISAFDAEEQMPPEDAYKLQVKFFYTGSILSSPGSYWFELGRYFSRGIEYYIGDHKEIRKAAEDAIGPETDPEKRLRKLYARAQEIRNLTYERHRTEKEQKREELKENKNVADVLKHGYGNRNEITRFFVALARATGFTSSVVFVSNRESRIFEREDLTFSQLDSEIAGVRLGGKTVFLDPGTRFCPYGLLRWMRTGTAAMDMRDPGTFVSTPGSGQDSAVITRSALLKLSPDGALKGELHVAYLGEEALERRLGALDTDDAGRKKDLEDEVKHWLPANAKAELTASAALEKEYEPLTAVFEIEVPEYASLLSDRLLLTTSLFQPQRKRLLKAGPRKYPIYYPYAFAEEDNITIELPEGFSAETPAATQSANLPYAKYQVAASASGNKLQIERTLMVNGIFFKPTQYDELRDFFGKVQAGDDSQSVLRRGKAAPGSKSN